MGSCRILLLACTGCNCVVDNKVLVELLMVAASGSHEALLVSTGFSCVVDSKVVPELVRAAVLKCGALLVSASCNCVVDSKVLAKLARTAVLEPITIMGTKRKHTNH